MQPSSGISTKIEKNLPILTKFDTYAEKFSVDGDLLNTLRKKAAEAKLTCNDDEFEQSKPMLCLQIKR